MTDPPVVGLVGLLFARLTHARVLLVCQDIHPEIGLITGRLTNRLLVWILRTVQRLLLLQADHVVAIGDTMRARLIERGADARATSVISNWADLDVIGPEARRNPWAESTRLAEDFVVMHSGNIGQLQDLDTLLEVAQALAEVRFAIVGGGSTRQALVDRAARLGLDNVIFLPHQPATQLRYSLASADVQVVSVAPGLAGFMEPSKVYGILAAARPLLAAVDPDSEAARIVRATGCGFVVPPRDVSAWCAAIKDLRRIGPEERMRLGLAGRLWVEERHSRVVATSDYRRLLLTLIAKTEF